MAPTGITKKRTIASSSEAATVSPQSQPPISSISSSSVICALAEIAIALKPIFSDSPSATTPRITGSLSSRCRLAQLTTGSEVTSIAPSGLREATAQVETPRIITPSSTAWPPTGASRPPHGLPSGISSGAVTGAARSRALPWLRESFPHSSAFAPGDFRPQPAAHAVA